MPPAFRALIEHFLAEHPAVQAAQADLERAQARARALGQPLFNPELKLEYEDSTDITKSIGVNQTFDWNGKRRARDRAGAESMRIASAALATARQELLAELLDKLTSLDSHVGKSSDCPLTKSSTQLDSPAPR
jgi:cobalt-zinc-cadmium efflux system outer membrane protein